MILLHYLSFSRAFSSLFHVQEFGRKTRGNVRSSIHQSTNPFFSIIINKRIEEAQHMYIYNQQQLGGIQTIEVQIAIKIEQFCSSNTHVVIKLERNHLVNYRVYLHNSKVFLGIHKKLKQAKRDQIRMRMAGPHIAQEQQATTKYYYYSNLVQQYKA